MNLLVGHRTFTVRPQVTRDVPKGRQWSGFCWKSKGIIGIDPKDVPEEQADTLLHEALHAIWHTQSLPDEVDEEEAVTKLAHGLIQLFRDNPAFLEAVHGGLAGKPIVVPAPKLKK